MTEKTDADIFDSLMAKPEAKEATPEPKDEKAEAKPAEESAPEPVAEATPEPESDDPVARLEKLQQQLQEREAALAEINSKLAKRDHEYAAIHGRLAPMQRELERLRGLEKSTPRAAEKAPDSMDFDSDEWKQYARDFPDEARILEKIHAPYRNKIAALEGVVGQLNERLEKQVAPKLSEFERMQYEAQRDRELNALNTDHPDWQEIVKGDEFRAWVQSQPQAIAQLANSDYANECAYVLKLFKQEHAQGNPEASRKQELRQENLRRSAAPKVGPNPSAQRNQPMNDAEIFDSLMARSRRA